MRLSDLRPKWVQPDAVRVSVPIYVGVSFDCPCCGDQRLSVRFRQPIDPNNMLADTGWRAREPAWERAGEDFDSLTLLPSIDFSLGGHWHGHIINGEIQ